MEKPSENKKEYKIKPLYIVKLEKFYKDILKEEKTKNKDNDSKY